MLTPVDAPIVSTTQELIGFELQCAKPIRQSQLPDYLWMLMGGQAPAEEKVVGVRTASDAEARQLRVLVVEDQPVNQELMQLMLRRLGCEVVLSDSAEEALESLAEWPQDVVFMDCLMPGMNGYEATAAIRRREPEDRRVVIIAMTALAMEGERERCLAAGMDDYLRKPVSEVMLRHTLKRWFPAVELMGERAGGAVAVNAEAGTGLRQIHVARPELTSKLVDLFLDDTARSLTAMRETLNRGDGNGLAKMAHALKGACLQLGETGMADLCGRLEAAGRSGDREAAKAELADLSKAFEQTSTGLLQMKVGVA
jgi:CheY-like chemotaxis protein/HPt (histidine-containing phosphotransfer) domain-containing protein